MSKQSDDLAMRIAKSIVRDRKHPFVHNKERLAMLIRRSLRRNKMMVEGLANKLSK